MVIFGFLGAEDARADFFVFDGTFNESDWLHLEANVTNGGLVEMSQIGDGDGNPGAFQRGVHTLAPPHFSRTTGAHFYSNPNGIYEPAAMGEIGLLDFVYQFKSSVVNGVNAVSHNPAVLQDGTIFMANSSYQLHSGESWTGYSITGLTAGDFEDIKLMHPDFSSNGSAIQFGYLAHNAADAGSTGTTIHTWGVDNFSAYASAVPEPSSGAILSVACAAFLARRRRRAK